MLYSLARPLLFTLAPERAHELTLSLLKSTHKLGLMRQNIAAKPVTCMGIEFPNPVGLAAGLDKNGAYIDALAGLGFGFIEIGTITPRPQQGNPLPRLFRIPQAKAIINRMGFNNAGVDQLIENVKAAKFKGVLGINIGKNADTPVENAVDDYLICLEKVYNYASYITVNISSTVRSDAINSSFAGISMPYTFGYFTIGAAEAKKTFFAPASRAIWIISLHVVPRTIESSTKSTFLPWNSSSTGFNF